MPAAAFQDAGKADDHSGRADKAREELRRDGGQRLRWERQNHVQRNHALALVLGLTGGVSGRRSGTRSRQGLCEPSCQKQVSAEQFVLVDGAGKTLAQLAKAGDGSPCLFLYDKDGKVRLEAGVYGPGDGGGGFFSSRTPRARPSRS